MARRPSLLLALAAVLAGVNAQVATPGQAVPGATCPYELNDQIQACRVQVYTIEAALPQGPCWSTDWPCICNVQQGLLDCYAPCPGSTPQTDIDYNNANCAGQNGYSNAAAVPGGVPYSWDILTTTGSGTGLVASSTTALRSTSSTSLRTTPSTTSTRSRSSLAADSTTTIDRTVANTPTGPNAAVGSSSTPLSSPTARATPVQSPSGNVFEGQRSGAFKMQGNGAGEVMQAILLMGLTAFVLVIA